MTVGLFFMSIVAVCAGWLYYELRNAPVVDENENIITDEDARRN